MIADSLTQFKSNRSQISDTYAFAHQLKSVSTFDYKDLKEKLKFCCKLHKISPIHLLYFYSTKIDSLSSHKIHNTVL